MKLLEIPVQDVYPDENNPRDDFGDIDALAESFALNETNPGEPVNPIVVVRDGGIYRIVDGERRWRAMRKAGTERCHAVVCDGMDEANSMVAMLTTDDKLGLTDIERSRGVQQMLLLGVDPEKVERAGRMAKGSAARVRRARRVVDDAGEDMTIDHMIAIGEFEEKGDADAVARLIAAKESDWRRVRDQIVQEREDDRRAAEILACLQAQGVAVVDEKPDGYVYAGRISNVGSAEGVAERYEGERIVAVRGENGWNRDSYELYMDEKIDADELALELAAKDIIPYIRAMDDAHILWFDAHFDDPAGMPHVMAQVEDAIADLTVYKFDEKVGAYEKAVGREIDTTPSPAQVAAGYISSRPNLDEGQIRDAVNGGEWGAARFRRWFEWCRTFEEDGFEPPAIWKRIEEFSLEHGIEIEEEEASDER